MTSWVGPLLVSHILAKFGGHSHRGSGDIIVLFCHAILQDHVTKGYSNIMERNLATLVSILPSLVAIDPVVVGI